MIGANFSAIRGTKPHEYLMRFAFGGAATVLAGVIARHWGPGPGGLFLAFPAIFPASVTLISTHERRRKHRSGLPGTGRGRLAASLEAVGATMGCVGLMAFAVVLWLLLPRHTGWWVVPLATAVWTAVATACWWVRRKRVFRRRARPFFRHSAQPVTHR